MNAPLHLVLLICALVCFLISAFGVPVQRINLLSLGLFFWCLATLVSRS